MKLVLSAPSKTFLLGEYAALVGCPSLVLNTEPRFELSLEQSSSFTIEGIEAGSPAGRFIQHYQTFFKPYSLKFTDPHQKQGGFGASSAQFLMVYYLYQILQKFNKNLIAETKLLTRLLNPQQLDFRADLLTTYLHYAWNGTGIAPSGADIVGQLYGQITWFDKFNNLTKSFTWPFPDLQPLLIRTGVKVATHEHLKQLTHIPAKPFAAILASAYQSLNETNEPIFLQAIKDYADTLATHQFVAPTTQILLHKLAQLPYILAAKGCGALGADVIVCFIRPQNLTKLQTWLAQQNLHYFTAHASSGLQID